MKILFRSVFLSGMAAIVAVSACAQEPTVACPAAVQDGTVLASHRDGDRVVNFIRAAPADGDPGAVIEVVSHRTGSGCATAYVDTYHYEGGEPTLEASFTHTVQGQPNLFAIVSWPRLHAGVGINARQYAVHAYRVVDGELVTNDLVVGNQQLHSGFEGIMDGEPSTFEGTTEQSVVAMLERLGLE